MGIFNELGRQVEKFKQNAKIAADEHVVYQCRACGEQFEIRHEQCPECGGEVVASTPS